MPNSMVTRAGSILVTPGREWQAIAAHPPAAAHTALYAAIMLVLPPLILVAMGLAGITFKYATTQVVFSVGLAGLIATTMLVFALSAIVRWVVPAFDGSTSFGRALAFVIFATTPMWLAAAIGNLFVPIQPLAALIGFVWAIVLIVKGAGPMFAIADHKRGVFAFTVTLSLVVFWLIVLMFTAGLMRVMAQG